MSKRALVVLYEGRELPGQAIDGIVQIMKQCGIIGKLSIHLLSPEDIAKGLVHPIINSTITSSDTSELTPEENAIVYIGTKFKNILKDENTSSLSRTIAFSSAFASYVTSVKYTQADTQMVNALDIIKDAANNKSLKIAKSLRTKYGISDGIFDCIVRIATYV